MKKRILVLMFLAFSSLTYSQYTVDSLTNELSYREVVKVNLKKPQIKNLTNSWFAKTFKSAESVIQSNTDDNIIGKPLIKINTNTNGYSVELKYYFIIDIAFKEGRYKIEIDNIYLKAQGSKVPFISYQGLTKEKMLKFIRKSFYDLGFKEDEIEKQMKIYSDPKTLEAAYQQGMIIGKKNEKDLKERLDNLINGLKEHIKKNQKDDW